MSPPKLLVNGRTFYTSRASLEDIPLHAPSSTNIESTEREPTPTPFLNKMRSMFLREDSKKEPATSSSSLSEKAPFTRSSSSTGSISLPIAKDRRTCTLPPPHRHGWKPETMKPPVLLSFAGATLLIAALIEILAQQSQEAGGLSIVKSADDIPLSVTFTFLYLPTIIAVLYSLAWNWIDLDVKRIQPWLELSKPGGASGRDSLFLDYPFDFVASVPFKAAKRKHWAVFYSGTVTVLIFWIITPLQSAIIGTGPVLVKQSVAMEYPQAFVNTSYQAQLFDQSILNSGYAINWLNELYPPFTTPEYALLPFYPASLGSPSSSGTASNWTGSTTKYWTDLTCWPADITKSPLWESYNFYDGRHCNVTDLAPAYGLIDEAGYALHYAGWQDSAWAQSSLASPTCGKSAQHEFLATWTHRPGNQSSPISLAAVFCETSYSKQNVTVTMDAATLKPRSDTIRPLSPAEKLQTKEFNSSAFEYLLGAGVSSVDVPRDKPFTYLVENYARLKAKKVGYPVYPLTGIALGMHDMQNKSIGVFQDKDRQSELYRGAHKAMFSVAFARILANATSFNQTEGSLTYAEYGFIVSRTFSVIVEAVLLIAAILTMALLWEGHRSVCMLSKDAASLGALVDIAKDSPEVLDKFSGKGNASDELLLQQLGQNQFELVCGCQDRSGVAKLKLVQDIRETTRFSYDSKPAARGLPQSGHYTPISPFVLSKTTGSIFVVLLSSAVGVLAWLTIQDQKYDGLDLPSTQLEVNLILTSYLPTIFSTLIEPFWVLLNRMLCILQPFMDLHKPGPSTATGSALKVKYTAVPPQLAIVEAAKSKHYMLALLSIVSLLANVLAVGLGALFNDLPKQTVRPTMISVMKDAAFVDEQINVLNDDVFTAIPSVYEDPYYVAMANYSTTTRLPPWTTRDFYFLPVQLPQKENSLDSTYLITTQGIGVDPKCVPMGPFYATLGPPVLDLTSKALGGPWKDCPKTWQSKSLDFSLALNSLPRGIAAAEVSDTPAPNANSFNVTECDETFIAGWARANIKNKTTPMDSSFVLCHPELLRAEFELRINDDGYVQGARRTGSFSHTMASSNSTQQLSWLLNIMNHHLRDGTLQWHKPVISSDWLNYLLKIQMQRDDFLNPGKHVPDPNDLLGPVGDVYKLLFAVYLSLHPQLLANKTSETQLLASVESQETKIFISAAAISICFCILALYIITAISFYITISKCPLPRMPTTLGSLLAYIAPSRLVREDLGRQSAQHPEQLGFGRFIGEDGRAHIGIEVARLVVPIQASALERGDTQGGKWQKLLRSYRRTETWL